MAKKIALREEDTMFPVEEIAIFKFDEELALEERRKPKVTVDCIGYRRRRIAHIASRKASTGPKRTSTRKSTGGTSAQHAGGN
jgi:hypothetical protein